MNNKLNKFLISLSGLMTVTLGVMGLKFQKETADILKLKKNLQSSLVSAEKVESMLEVQKKLEAARMENLKKVDTARIGTKTETKTQTVIVPGKTVPQTTTKKTTAKTTKTS